MQLNPQEMVDRGVITTGNHTQVQQVGIDCSLISSFKLQHGESHNVNFTEAVNLPINIFSLFYPRSSLSRQGVFVSTGVYDPGYQGSVGCTIYNMSGREMKFEKGDRVGQMVFFRADAASSYDGKWQNT